MKKILVTGATGFIGGYVIDELLKRGHTVIATSATEGKAKSNDWYNKVDYIPFDLKQLRPEADYYNFFKTPNLLIHLAWEGLPNYKSAFHLEENLPRHISFLSNLVQNGLKDLTVTGTCFEYGMQEGCLQEDMPVLPDNPYGKAKNDLRRQLEVLRKTYPFSFKWIRLFYMYGKGQNPNSLLSQLDRALAAEEDTFNMSGGQQVRDYLPVEKVAENIVKIALQSSVEGVINNCSGIPVTVKGFVEDYLRRINKNITLNLGHYPYSDYEPMKFWGDVQKLNKIINNE
jgi:nucleoside-diphosphate-sugar epimerase